MPSLTPIFIPVEISAREFDAKLLMAVHLVEDDTRVFVGETKSIHRLAAGFKNGLYVGKQAVLGGASPNLKKYHALKKDGHRVLFQAEEELLLDASKVDMSQFLMMFDPRWISTDDYVCAWGEVTAAMFKSAAPDHAPHIIATGHPKFDLCKSRFSRFFDAEVADIRRRFGDFVLLNTKFAFASNFAALVSAIKDFSDDKPDNYWLGFFKYHSDLQSAYICLAARLSRELAGVNIVLRPHPGENPAAYREVLQAYPNVHVLTEGSVVPWLAAARALVHTGCTTALEAVRLTPTIINYQPVFDEHYDEPGPRKISIQCRSETEVVDLLKSGTLQDKTSLDCSEINRLIENYPSEKCASATIAAIAAEVKKQLGSAEARPGVLLMTRLHGLLDKLKSRLRTRKGMTKYQPSSPVSILQRVAACGEMLDKPLKTRLHGDRFLEITLQ
ncbi:MAG: surface carbohydrate biosynthesis protein [Prosthecobacter sp.]|uniref:surface carbohydrate biosynthesis protein n=1 Tax=Prosthecobacter sp. TaxID=1965333 RepID=UPI0038FDA578